eukprot:2492486-Rhodomonas_salina.1
MSGTDVGYGGTAAAERSRAHAARMTAQIAHLLRTARAEQVLLLLLLFLEAALLFLEAVMLFMEAVL